MVAFDNGSRLRRETLARTDWEMLLRDIAVLERAYQRECHRKQHRRDHHYIIGRLHRQHLPK